MNPLGPSLPLRMTQLHSFFWLTGVALHPMVCARTRLQRHGVAGQAPSRGRLRHGGDREQGAAGQAPQGAGLSGAAALVQPCLSPGSHRVSGLIIGGLPAHMNHGKVIL